MRTQSLLQYFEIMIATNADMCTIISTLQNKYLRILFQPVPRKDLNIYMLLTEILY